MPTIDQVITRLQEMKERYGGDGDTPIAYDFWVPEDVYEMAKEEGFGIENKDEPGISLIGEVLHAMMRAHDANIGLNWLVLQNALAEVCGRETKTG